jgi:hypothetical protein
MFFDSQNDIDEELENAQSHSSVDVELKAAKCANYFQVRGYPTPGWFKGKIKDFFCKILCVTSIFFLKGFYTAYPGGGSNVQCVRTPSDAILNAWTKLKPTLVKTIY